MSRLMYARLSGQGTATAETALCDSCLSDASVRKRLLRELDPFEPDPPVGPWVDCSGNEALSCQQCGWVEERDRTEERRPMSRRLPMPSSSPRKIGDRVRYKQWTGNVYEVQSDGRLLIDWTCWPQPFFAGPYWPEEVVDVVE